MKIFINTTEDWKEIKEAVKDAEKYLSRFNVKIKLNKIDIDLSDDKLYDTQKSLNWFKIVETKSLSNLVIRTLGILKGGTGYDAYGLIVDKNKAKEDWSLFGQANKGLMTFEVYGYKGRRNKIMWKFPHTTYNLIHEILHLLSHKLGKKDTLHDWIDKNDSMDGYLDYLMPETQTIKFHKATHKWLGTWKLTQPFGVNNLSVYKEMGLKGHNGLDFYSPVGWKMYFNVETPNDITWTCYNYEDKFGKKVVSISDEKVPLKDGLHYVGVVHLHIRESKVRDGQKIKFGDYFAITGNTGQITTGAHTHEALKKTTKNGIALGKNNGYNGAIDHQEYYE